MEYETRELPWSKERVREELETAFAEKSEVKLLSILKKNSFLFYELYSRKYGIQPAFHEVSLGNMRCDFAWLNDNSDGPEWVLVEIDKPGLRLFTKQGTPTAALNNAIEQVKSWEQYFSQHPSEKKRIFGVVKNLRFILVAGNGKDWQAPIPSRWRMHHNNTSSIEIRSLDVFLRALKVLEEKPGELWSFAKHPTTNSPSDLEAYWQAYEYINNFRKLID